MSANALLLWISARGQGSWQQFRAAVEELHIGNDSGNAPQEEADATDQYALPLYQMLRLNLQRVGHAEFYAGAGSTDWRVTPPSLATTEHRTGWLGVFAGARSSRLLQRLYDAAAATTLESLSFPQYPDQIRLVMPDPSALTAIAQRAGLLLQHAAPTAILTSLPVIDDPGVRRRTDLPFGADWRIEQFAPSDLSWNAASREETLLTQAGLFRFSLGHQRLMLFCSRGTVFQVPGQVGKYLMLRRARRQVLCYDSANLRFSVPASCRPPFLVERALILCSGCPPSYETESAGGVLQYADIPAAVARLASALLRQELG